MTTPTPTTTSPATAVNPVGYGMTERRTSVVYVRPTAARKCAERNEGVRVTRITPTEAHAPRLPSTQVCR